MSEANPTNSARAADPIAPPHMLRKPTKQNVMLDLETLGQRPGAVIRAIGAVKFSAAGLGEEFYRRIDAQSCVDSGLQIDASTVMWWLKQSDAARAEMTLPGDHIAQVLVDFSRWLDPLENEIVLWGNGSDFDNAILAEAYHATKFELPWSFWNNRCYRTLKSLFPQRQQKSQCGVKHNALDDARSQAWHAIEFLYPRAR